MTTKVGFMSYTEGCNMKSKKESSKLKIQEKYMLYSP